MVFSVDNFQFLHEVALAQLELKALGVKLCSPPPI